MTHTSTPDSVGPSSRTLDFLRQFARAYKPVVDDEHIVVRHQEATIRPLGEG